ncbi:MAG: prephenate dehydrogenase [Caldilineaceae bacterium]|nr:prephenate dehydrogenase [Caldilineaceae bacterium]
MTKPIITIIGLGLTGTSMGLGLQREAGNFEIVGHDKQPEVAQQARKLGAVHRTEWNLFKACAGAELIVLAVPLHELEELLPLLAEEVKPGTLIFAIGSLLLPAIEKGAKHLPDGVHFVAGHAVITGVGATPSARPDLFEKAVFALAAGVKTDPAALQLASDFVERVGATPLFVDALEHDGVMAGVEHLPMLLAAALMRSSASGAGWREAKRLAGRHFAEATDVGGDAAALFAALQANKQSVVLKLQKMRQELAEWQVLLENDAENTIKSDNTQAVTVHPLLAALTEAVQARSSWETQVILKNWEEQPDAPVAKAESSGFLRQMFLGGLGNRQRKG